MYTLYESKRKSVWTRLEENSDIDELIYGLENLEDSTKEESSDR